MAAVERHFGEIIREGSVCRLYFDMEFGISQGACVPNLVHVSNLVDMSSARCLCAVSTLTWSLVFLKVCVSLIWYNVFNLVCHPRGVCVPSLL